jgi:hypothetical protein
MSWQDAEPTAKGGYAFDDRRACSTLDAIS